MAVVVVLEHLPTQRTVRQRSVLRVGRAPLQRDLLPNREKLVLGGRYDGRRRRRVAGVHPDRRCVFCAARVAYRQRCRVHSARRVGCGSSSAYLSSRSGEPVAEVPDVAQRIACVGIAASRSRRQLPQGARCLRSGRRSRRQWRRAVDGTRVGYAVDLPTVGIASVVEGLTYP